ncbi:chorismate--pyruvate lyase family protein [Candidatus Magnetaquicoccus inordinatus]|uniref:chorismate--pyruvate lyase family protein n=1 Tax=Candidatus Magnetaquicoccus inordinatus TaxID=2496818 RepID=UPI00102AF4B5|nr:chorismate pyruvate-lyase family protein [Candidatus Magnetaquicoccus inordinatus]
MSQLIMLSSLKEWLTPHEYFNKFAFPATHNLELALKCNKSLTKFLENLLNTNISVSVENQEELKPNLNRTELWGKVSIPENSPIIARSAWLISNNKRVIYAYSEIAVTMLDRSAKSAIESKIEPLGSLFLNRANDVERTNIKVTQAKNVNLSLVLSLDLNTVFWCRRSLFRVDHQLSARILEIYLPECCTA